MLILLFELKLLNPIPVNLSTIGKNPETFVIEYSNGNTNKLVSPLKPRKALPSGSINAGANSSLVSAINLNCKCRINSLLPI